MMQIKRNTPASRWGEAFAIGNGQIGGMIYGGIIAERIDLSENTFFSGNADEKNNQPGAADAFQKMRQAACEEDFDEVHRLAEDFIGVRRNYGTNLPVGYLEIETGLSEGEAKNYARALNLETGVVTSEWENCGQRIQTRAFASHVHRMLCYEMKTEKKVFQFQVKFHSPRGEEYGEYIRYNSDSIYFECKARETMHSDGTTGTFLAGKAVVLSDGQPNVTQEGLHLRNASKLTIFVLMETDFKEIRDGAAVFTEADYLKKGTQLQCLINRRLSAFEETEVDEILAEHEKDMTEMFERVSLEIEGEGPAADIPQMFQMGRYLLYSASRADSVLPAHLQGVWNDNVACRIGWTCDMHLDINTQMNYWPAEITNLPETTKPLFSWMKDSLAVKGRQSAKESYGLSGWIGELVSNSWGFAAPYWAAPLSPCPTGGVWVLTHMWEHYLSTMDMEFLEKEAYPLIEEAVEFFAGYLFEDYNGYLTCGPSISPENTFCVPGKEAGYQISNGCTYEILMIRELFEIFLKASEILKKESELVQKVTADAKRLLPYRIMKDGKIAEWSHDYPAADLQHRHTSHLLGVFPFAQITPEDKDLAKAAEKTIQAKLTPAENWEDTGWARSMLMLYEARLRHPKAAWNHICSMLDNLLEPNGFIIHPPTRGAAAFDNVYEMDGNTGLTSCIAEMLLQSHNGVIRLLPCVPKEWKKGHVKGLIARGGVSVEMKWNGSRCQAWLTAKKDGMYVIIKGRTQKEVSLRAGERTRVW